MRRRGAAVVAHPSDDHAGAIGGVRLRGGSVHFIRYILEDGRFKLAAAVLSTQKRNFPKGRRRRRRHRLFKWRR